MWFKWVLGDWTCQMFHNGGPPSTSQGIINLRTEGRYPDNIRLDPVLFKPEEYKLNLLTLWEPDWKIEGTFEYKN